MKTINAINVLNSFYSIELKYARQAPNAGWMKRQERRKSRRAQEANLAREAYDGIQQEALEFSLTAEALRPTVLRAVTVIRKRLSHRRIVETVMVPA